MGVTEEDQLVLTSLETRTGVLRLDDIQPPDPEDGDLATLRTLLADQASNGLAQDLFQLVADDVRTRAGIYLDQAALNAVHANF